MNKLNIKRHKKAIIILVILVAIAGFMTYNAIQRNLRAKADLLGMEVQDYENYMEELKETPSDIEGLSQYEKYKMGLDYRDGSDTDYDGLSDKEEMEIYHTDPLAASSAGDLYTDGYKIEHGLDPNEYKEYDGEVLFEYNECPEVILTADEPSDLFAVVEDYTNRYSLADFGIKDTYKGYWMYNYNGTLQIDVANIIEENNIEISDINVWVYQGDFLVSGISELEKCKYSKDDDVITLKYKFDKNAAYYVYLTGKQSKFSSLLSVTGNISSFQEHESSEKSGVAFVCGSPILEQLFGTSGHIYYSELSDDTENLTFVDRAINFCNTKILGSKITTEDTKKLTATDNLSVKARAELYQSILPMCEAVPEGEETVFNYLFNYTVYYDNGYKVSDGESSGEMGEAGKQQYYNNYHTEFDPYIDELPFQNFESQYATGGNCAGISHLTAYIFNTGSLPTSGSYNGITWDISVDAENKTLTDRGLYDYKGRFFVDENSGKNDNYLGEGLSSGEEEFVKMIGAFWSESNDKADLNEYVLSNGRTYDWSLAEKMMAYLDQGKIICVGMLFKNGTGHEVNLYDYYFTDAGELLFRVYDSNIPQNDREGYRLNCDGACYLQCKEVIRQDGTSSFTYLYYPVKGNTGYLAASATCLMEKNAIVVTDENWNVFND